MEVGKGTKLQERYPSITKINMHPKLKTNSRSALVTHILWKIVDMVFMETHI